MGYGEVKGGVGEGRGREGDEKGKGRGWEGEEKGMKGISWRWGMEKWREGGGEGRGRERDEKGKRRGWMGSRGGQKLKTNLESWYIIMYERYDNLNAFFINM